MHATIAVHEPSYNAAMRCNYRSFAVSSLCCLCTCLGMVAVASPPPVPLEARRLVGYLPQWGLYSTPAWLARDLVASGAAPLLDQLDYAQAGVRDGRCVIADPNADLAQVYTAAMSVDGKADLPAASFRGGLHQLALLKQSYPHLRTVISIEGKASAFAQAAQPDAREAFVASCLDMFLRGHLAPGVEAPGLFEGIDLDWEFPQNATEGANYLAVLAEFRRQLDVLDAARKLPLGAVRKPLRRRSLLTIAVGPGTGRYPGVDWAQVSPLVDEVGLMNYDYNGPWQQQTGMLAPLYTIEGDPRPQNTVEGTVLEYEAAGIAADKLLLGVPFYGYHWASVAAGNHGLFQPAQSVREDTPYSAIAGMVAHSTLYRDSRSQAPWLFDGQTFWTFDDPASVRAKAVFAAAHGLAGVMVWELSGDTADAKLLRAIHTGLAVQGADAARAPGAAPVSVRGPVATTGP